MYSVDLIDVEDELLDEDYIDYFAEVEKKISVIEYRQLRKNWLDYQKCTTDVVGFCKKTKILLRGADRLHLCMVCLYVRMCVCLCMTSLLFNCLLQG